MKNGAKSSVSEDRYDVNKKSLFVMFILLFLLVVLVIGVSYQVYLYTTEGKSLIRKIIGQDNDIFKNGSATIVYTEGNGINLENAIPMADEDGMVLSNSNQMMDFTVDVTINKSSSISYEVVAEKDPSSTIDDKYIKLYLQKSLKQSTYEESVFLPHVFEGISDVDEYGAPVGSMVLDQMTTSEPISSYYRLRMWLDSTYPLDNNQNVFKIKVSVYGKGERIKYKQ